MLEVKTKDHEKVLTELEVLEKTMLEETEAAGELRKQIKDLEEELRTARILGNTLEPDIHHHNVE